MRALDVTWLAATCAVVLGCRRHPAPSEQGAPPPILQNATEPELQIVGETTRLRISDATPQVSPWFDGQTLAVTAARGEIIGLQVIHRADGKAGGAVTLHWKDATGKGVAGVTTRGYTVEPLPVVRPSTGLYGGSHGAGWYADGLILAGPTGKQLDPAPSSDPAYFEIEVARDAAPGVIAGELVAGGRRVAVELTIAPVTLPPLPIRVWAYENTTESTWAGINEKLCIDTFRRYGVLLSPDIHRIDLPVRQDLLMKPEIRDVPVWISEWAPLASAEVKAWIETFRGTGQVPFAIPIDEPRTPEARQRVRALADVVRAAGGGPDTFRFAVTDAPDEIYGDAIDLYISPAAAHLQGDRVARWTYNGAPPRAGAMVLDAEAPGMRTWGWIAWRWKIPLWYVWDATYWHDRHNRKDLPIAQRALDLRRDAVSFDDGEDHGNLDGVLALPGCQPTLRLAALRRGYQDYELLEQAAACDRPAAEQLAATMVPLALGDAPVHGAPAWPSDEASWESARRRLISIAARCAK